MDNQQKTHYVKCTLRDCSITFRLQFITEVEQSELSYKQAQDKYGIQGSDTGLKRIRKMFKINLGYKQD